MTEKKEIAAPMAHPAMGHLLSGTVSPALQIMLDDHLFERAKQMATYLSKAEGFTPRHLIGKPEACFAVVTRSITWKLDPFAVAQSTYQTPGGNVGYEGKLCQAILENSGQLEGPVRFEHYGNWSAVQGKFKLATSQKGNKYPVPNWKDEDEVGLGVIVSAKVKGEPEPRTWEFALVQAFPRNSTLWATDPKTQICYTAVRRFASVAAPGLFMGVPFDREDSNIGFDNAVDVTPRPARSDFDAPSAQAVIEDDGAVIYELANENGETIEKISNGSGPWVEAFIHHVKNANTLKAIEALGVANAATIDAVAENSAQNAKAARLWLTERHDEIRAELDRKAEERKKKAKGEPEEPEPTAADYLLIDHTGENSMSSKDVDQLMRMMQEAVKRTAPNELPALFENNIYLLARLSEEGLDSTVEWFEAACEPPQETEAEPGREAAEEPDGRPAPPEQDDAHAEAIAEYQAEEAAAKAEEVDPQKYRVTLPMKATGGPNWSSFNTVFERALQKCPFEHLDMFVEVNQATLNRCAKESDWYKGVMNSIGARREAG